MVRKMNIEEDQREVESLLSQLDAAYSEWKKNSLKKTEIDSETKAKLIRKLVAEQYIKKNPNLELIKKIEAQLNPVPDVIDISVSPIELLSILQALNFYIQSFEAERYIKKSIREKIPSQERWTKVAELMLIKEPNKKLSRYSDDMFSLYWGAVQAGIKPREASEIVFKKFKLNNLEALDKWLNDEINRRQKEASEHGGTNIYADIPKPHKWDRNK